jgi:putative SOS response-associated peptidase YedK
LARLADQFGIRPEDLVGVWQGRFAERYNIAPTQQVPAIRAEDDGRRNLVPLRWGLVPSWSKDGKIAPINAMSETVADELMFRTAFKKRRCLVPADGYYEWLKTGKRKQPVHYHLRNGARFGFAGIWETWRGPGTDDAVESVAILTREAHVLARQVHNRMPVILRPEDYDEWLDPKVEDKAILEPLLRPYQAEQMEATPVSDYVNNARHEGPKCLESA